MKKARLKDGQIVLAHQYNAAVHGKELCCADPKCPAVMGYRKEAITHGAQALKEAHFFSHSVKEHTPKCTAHDGLSIPARTIASIEKSVKAGKNIVINLNLDLTGTFNNTVKNFNLMGVSSTYRVHNYKAAGVKSVEDVLKVADAIFGAGGEAALEKTYVNYKGKTERFNNFYVRTTQQYSAILNKLLSHAKNGTSDTVSDFPRLIEFKTTGNTRANKKNPIRGTPINLMNDQKQRVVLMQHADADASYDLALRGENHFVIAEPTLTRREALNMQARLDNKEEYAYLDLHWKIVSVNQFTPIDTGPKPEQTKLKI